jgi:hypothetical protein
MGTFMRTNSYVIIVELVKTSTPFDSFSRLFASFIARFLHDNLKISETYSLASLTSIVISSMWTRLS